MPLQVPHVDIHETMLAEMNDAIDRITLRPTPGDLPRHVRFNTILVAHNATIESQRALDWAAAIARVHGSEVIVASVSPQMRAHAEGPLGMGSYWTSMVEENRRAEQEMAEACENGAAYLRVNGVRSRGVHATGGTTSELARLARVYHADLVVVGAIERGLVTRALFGNVGEALAGRLDASILIARDLPDLRRILVATDGSPESDRAVTLALEIASSRKSDLTVQHVLEYSGTRDAIPPEGYLQGIVERMTLPTPPRVRYVIDVGWPDEKIVQRAASDACGLIVLGAHGVGRVRGAILGSVCHRVAVATPASVLLVRGGPEE